MATKTNTPATAKPAKAAGVPPKGAQSTSPIKPPSPKPAPKPTTAKTGGTASSKPPAKGKTAPKEGQEATSRPAAAKPSPKSTTPKPELKPTPKPAAPTVTAPVSTVPSPKPPAGKKQKWDEIRELLTGMKEATLQEITRSIKSGSEATVGEETTGDIYDQASSERDRELELLLSDRERQKLHNIDDALLRMAEGEYGICEECDEEIPLGRLKAMPFTRHCVKCKSDLERLQAQTRRVEEDRAYREIPLGEDDEG